MTHDICFFYISPILSVLIILSNFVEIMVMLRQKGKIMPSMIYILNLSISDLLIGIIILGIFILYQIRSPKLLQFYLAMKFVLLRLSFIMSCLNLICITFDRFIAVARPVLYRKIKQRHPIAVCCLLWFICALVLSILYCLIVYYPSLILPRYRFLHLLYPITIFVTALVLLIGYYQIIQRMMESRQRAISHAVPQITITEADAAGNLSTKRRTKKEWQVIKMTIVIIAFYIICWFPFAVYNMAQTFGIKDKNATDALYCVAVLNSLFDPIIYFHFIRKEVMSAIKKSKKYLFKQKKKDHGKRGRENNEKHDVARKQGINEVHNTYDNTTTSL